MGINTSYRDLTVKVLLLPSLILKPWKKELTGWGHLQDGEAHCSRGSDISSLNLSKETQLWKLHSAESTACPAVKEMSLTVKLEITVPSWMKQFVMQYLLGQVTWGHKKLYLSSTFRDKLHLFFMYSCLHTIPETIKHRILCCVYKQSYWLVFLERPLWKQFERYKWIWQVKIYKHSSP